jgi:H+/gluconate symporter-like permease
MLLNLLLLVPLLEKFEAIHGSLITLSLFTGRKWFAALICYFVVVAGGHTHRDRSIHTYTQTCTHTYTRLRGKGKI